MLDQQGLCYWYDNPWLSFISLNVCISLNLQAEHILDLQKQLTLLDGNPRRESNGGLTEESITSMTPADKVCFYIIS